MGWGMGNTYMNILRNMRMRYYVFFDPNKMSEMFEDMPLSFPLASMLLGTAAITMFGFGYFALQKL